MPLNPHDYAAARRCAEHLRQAEHENFWRSSDAACSRTTPSSARRWGRSSTRFWAALTRQTRRPANCP